MSHQLLMYIFLGHIYILYVNSSILKSISRLSLIFYYTDSKKFISYAYAYILAIQHINMFFGVILKGDDGGEESKNFFRNVIPMLYDPKALQAVLEEWAIGVSELPSTIKRAVEMSLYSSAHLYRFFSMEVRPSAARSIARSLPYQVSSLSKKIYKRFYQIID